MVTGIMNSTTSTSPHEKDGKLVENILFRDILFNGVDNK